MTVWCKLLCLIAVMPQSAAAQEPAQEQPVSVEQIAAVRKQAETAEGLTAEVKNKVLELCGQAEKHLNAAAKLHALTQQYHKDTASIARRVADLSARIKQLEQVEPKPPEADSLAKLEQELTRRELQLNDAKSRLKQTEAQIAERPKRRKQNRDLLESLPQAIVQIQKQIGSLSAGQEPPVLMQGRRLELLARQLMLQRQLDSLKAELAKYDAEDAADWTRLERDLYRLEAALAEKEHALAAELVRKGRAEQAKRAVQAARFEAVVTHPLLKPYADENSLLAEAAQKIAQTLAGAEADLAAVQRIAMRSKTFQRKRVPKWKASA